MILPHLTKYRTLSWYPGPVKLIVFPANVKSAWALLSGIAFAHPRPGVNCSLVPGVSVLAEHG